jgi:hypothetical protein
MKRSPLVTDAVALFALPWAHHMRYLMGAAAEPNIIGLLIHTLGIPICNVAGFIYNTTFIPTTNDLSNFFTIARFLLMAFATSAIIIITIKLWSKNRLEEDNFSSSALLFLIGVYYFILGKSQDFLEVGFTKTRIHFSVNGKNK